MPSMPKSITGPLQQMRATYRFNHRAKSPPVECLVIDLETNKPYANRGYGSSEEEALRDGIAKASKGGKPRGAADLAAENEALRAELAALRAGAGRPEPEDDEEEALEEAVEEPWHADMTVSDLRAVLDTNQIDIPSGAKKADLIALIEQNNLA